MQYRYAILTRHQDMRQYRQDMQYIKTCRTSRLWHAIHQDVQYWQNIKICNTGKKCKTDLTRDIDKTCNTSRHSRQTRHAIQTRYSIQTRHAIHQDIQYIKTFNTSRHSKQTRHPIPWQTRYAIQSRQAINPINQVLRDTVWRGGHAGKYRQDMQYIKTLEGDSGKRTPSKGLLQDTNLTSCFPMSSCIPLYLLDANDLHSITAFASLRPAVGPSYGLFVEQSADPIDNPARPTLAAPYRAHHTSSESNNDRHEPIGPLLTKNVPQPKRVAKLTL